MAEAAFSDDGNYFAAISTDGRLKIWDTETNQLKQQYTPDLHLTSPPSCLQWLTLSLSTGQKQNKKKKTHCIALGLHTGKILVYSIAQAKVETVLSAKSVNRVTALDWNSQYGLYSCTKDDSLVEWDMEKGSHRNYYKIAVESKNKQGNHVSAIKIVPHKLETEAHYLVAASWQVRLWRLHKGEATIVKTLGHNASQTALLSIARVNDVCWLIQGSQNERLLSFWDITLSSDHITNGDVEDSSPSKKRRKKSLTNIPVVNTPSYNFVLEDAPRVVDACLIEEGGSVRVSLSAATRSGVLHYYNYVLNGSSVKPMKPSVTIHSTTSEAVPLPLQCCRLQPSGELLVGYTRGHTIIFETVIPDLKTKTQVLIREEKKVKQKQGEANKVKSGHNGQAQVLEALGGVAGRKRMVAGGTIEVPMEARLSNLTLDPNSRTQAAASENFTKLLMQGLKSNDKEIIKSVLLNQDSQVALTTVTSLPAECVPPLLKELAAMAARKTSLCLCVCTWLTAILQCHSALLLALMNSAHSDTLTHLLAIFTNRRSHLCQLMNLRGRLELTIKQRNASARIHDTKKPLLEYRDASSDDELPMNERTRSDSEGSWNDDKFESDRSDDDEMEQSASDESDDDE